MENVVIIDIKDYTDIILKNHKLENENNEYRNERYELEYKRDLYKARWKFLIYEISLMKSDEPPENIQEYALATVVGNGIRGKQTKFKSVNGEEYQIAPYEVNLILGINDNNHMTIRNIIEDLRQKYPKLIDLDDNYEIADFSMIEVLYKDRCLVHDNRNIFS